MREADLYLGDIIVTYLNLDVFNRQLAKIKSTTLPKMKSTTLPEENYPSAILRGSLPQSNINRLAVRFLRSKKSSRFDLQSQLKTAVQIVDRSEKPTPQAHSFLPYAQEHWLFHTKMFKPTRVPVYNLLKRLVHKEVETVESPRALDRLLQFDDDLVAFARNLKHFSVLSRALDLLLNFLETTAPDLNVNIVDFEFALYMASSWNSEAIVLLSLKKRVDINVKAGFHGNALQTASYQGHEEIVRLLLENGANVNAEGGRTYGTALQAASFQGHEEMVRLLLNNGANVNAEGGQYGSAWYIASELGHKRIVRLLLENGAVANDAAMAAANNASGNGEVKKLIRNALKHQQGNSSIVGS
ncbi:hypothetical protein MMC29_003904 [Sticta canariensis]|nr:hypothetical protein [Sticta canariensis]